MGAYQTPNWLMQRRQAQPSVTRSFQDPNLDLGTQLQQAGLQGVPGYGGPLYGSALTLPGRSGWVQGLTPDEVSRITSQNQMASNVVGQMGGPQGFVNTTQGGTTNPNTWNLNLPQFQSNTDYNGQLNSPADYYRALPNPVPDTRAGVIGTGTRPSDLPTNNSTRSIGNQNTSSFNTQRGVADMPGASQVPFNEGGNVVNSGAGNNIDFSGITRNGEPWSPSNTNTDGSPRTVSNRSFTPATSQRSTYSPTANASRGINTQVQDTRYTQPSGGASIPQNYNQSSNYPQAWQSANPNQFINVSGGYTRPPASQPSAGQPSGVQPQGNNQQNLAGTGLPYNPVPWQANTDPNMDFINQSGGFDFGQASGLYNFLMSMLGPSSQNALASAQSGNDALANFIYSTFPTGMSDYLNSSIGTQGQQATNLQTAGFNALWPYLDQLGPLLMNQLQSGVPGTADAYSNMSNQSNLSNYLLSGTGQQNPNGGSNYGLSQFYNQILNNGMPNQQAIQDIVPSQLPYATGMQDQYAQLLQQLQGGGSIPFTGIQQQTADTLGGLIQGGGLSPEYVQAMTERVLNPMQEQMTGQINQMAGGAASLSSPAYQELLRRNQSDFMNDLITTGANNMSNYMGLGANMGAQQFGQGTTLAGMYGQGGQNALQNALQAYGIVPSSVAPFSGQASGLTSDLSNQALQGYLGAGNLGLNNLNTINSLMYQPYTTGLNASNMTQNQAQQLLNMYMGAGLGQNQNQNQFASSLLGQYGNMSSDVLRGYLTQMMMNNQNSQASATNLGDIAAKGIDAIGGIRTNPTTGSGGPTVPTTGGRTVPVLNPVENPPMSTPPTFPQGTSSARTTFPTGTDRGTGTSTRGTSTEGTGGGGGGGGDVPEGTSTVRIDYPNLGARGDIPYGGASWAPGGDDPLPEFANMTPQQWEEWKAEHRLPGYGGSDALDWNYYQDNPFISLGGGGASGRFDDWWSRIINGEWPMGFGEA